MEAIEGDDPTWARLEGRDVSTEFIRHCVEAGRALGRAEKVEAQRDDAWEAGRKRGLAEWEEFSSHGLAQVVARAKAVGASEELAGLFRWLREMNGAVDEPDEALEGLMQLIDRELPHRARVDAPAQPAPWRKVLQLWVDWAMSDPPGGYDLDHLEHLVKLSREALGEGGAK